MLIKVCDDIRVYACAIDKMVVEKFGAVRAQQLAICGLLQEAFPDREEVALSHHPSGAPYLPGESAAISITHCSGVAALALAPAGIPVGIDCETTSRHGQLERVKQRFLSSSQLSEWGDFPKTLQAWGIKEALYKAFLTPGVELTDIPLPATLPGEVDFRGQQYKLLSLDTPFAGVSTVLAWRSG